MTSIVEEQLNNSTLGWYPIDTHPDIQHESCPASHVVCSESARVCSESVFVWLRVCARLALGLCTSGPGSESVCVCSESVRVWLRVCARLAPSLCASALSLCASGSESVRVCSESVRVWLPRPVARQLRGRGLTSGAPTVRPAPAHGVLVIPPSPPRSHGMR